MTFYSRAGSAFSAGATLGSAVNLAQTTSSDSQARRAGQVFVDPRVTAFQAAAAQQRQVPQAGSSAGSIGPAVDWFSRWAGNWITRGLTAADRHIFSPITDYYQSAFRYGYDEMRQGNATGNPLRSLEGLGNAAGAIIPGAAMVDENFRRNYWEPERRASVAGRGSTFMQTVWELGSLDDRGNRYNPQTGRTELPLLDDDDRWAEREAYFHAGPQKWVTGIGDAVLSLAMDPTIVGGEVAGVALKGARTLQAASITEAAATGRGAAVARRLADEEGPMTRVVDGTEAPESMPTGQTDFPGVQAERPRDMVDDFEEPSKAVTDPRAEEPYEAPQAMGEAPADPSKLSQAHRLRTSVERLTDYVWNRHGEAGTVADLRNDPVLGQSSETGAIADAMSYVASTYSDEAIAKGIMDDLQYAALGDRDALGRIGARNKKMQLDFERLMRTDDEAAREFIEADIRLTQAEKQKILDDDELFQEQAKIISEEVARHVSDLSRIEQRALAGRSLAEAGALGAPGEISQLPLLTNARRQLQGTAGNMKVAKAVRVFQSLPPVQILTGIHVPETIRFNDDQAVEIFDRYVKETQRKLGRGLGNDPIFDQMRDEFARARGDLDPALSRSQRQDVLHRFNNEMARRLAAKYALHYRVEPSEVKAWIDYARDIRESDLAAFQQRARRAVDSNSPLVHRTPDGNIWATSPETAKAISGGQTAQVGAVIDWGRMDFMLKHRFKPGLISEDPVSAKSKATRRRFQATEAAFAEINDLWKFAALFRPAYPMRVQMDTQARRLATTGALDYFAEIATSLGNFAGNFKRVPTHVADLFAHKVRAFDELEDVEDRLASALPRSKDYQRLQARRAELQEVLRWTPDEYKAMLQRDGAQVIDQRVWRRQTEMKRVQGSSAQMDAKTGEFVGPSWDDAYRYGQRSLSQNIMEDATQSINGLMTTLHGHMRKRRMKPQYPYVEYGTTEHSRKRWLHAYVDHVNHHIRGDSGFTILLNGGTADDLAHWMRHDPKGREYFAMLAGGKKGNTPKFRNPEELAAKQKGIFDTLLPNQDAIDTLLARDIDIEDVANWWQDGATRPLLPARAEDALEPTLTSPLREPYDAARARYFRIASTLPEGMMGRHPVYQRLYRDHIRRLAASVGGAEADGLSRETLRQLARQADRLARKDMGKIMFDTTHKSNMAYHMRFMSPFFSAWSDTMRKWAYIEAQNPAALPAMYRTFESTASGAVVVDNDGNRIMPDGTVWELDENGRPVRQIGHNANPGSGYMMIQMPSWLQNWTGAEDFRVSRGSLNAIFQGEQPFLPGLGPIVSIPTNEIITKGIPFIKPTQGMFQQYGDNWLVENLLNPYGQTDEPLDMQIMPNWMQALRRLVDTGSSQSVQTYAQLMADELNRQSLTGERLNPIETQKKVQTQLRNWWLLRLFGTSAIPVSTSPNSRLAWYRDTYRRYQREGIVNGKTAEDRFLEDYPDYAEATIALSYNETGITASEPAWDAIQEWRDEIGHAPEIGWALAGPANYAGDFSDAVYTAQKVQRISGGTSKTFRSQRPIEDVQKEIETEKGWREWRAVNDMIDERLTQLGISSLASNEATEIRALRDEYLSDLKSRYPTWAKDYDKGVEVGANPVGDFLDSMQGVVERNPKRVAARQDLQQMATYLQARELVRQKFLEVAAEAGISRRTLWYDPSRGTEEEYLARLEDDDPRLVDIYLEWEAFKKQLRDESPAFAQMYSRARLDRDNLNSEVRGS